MNFSGTFKGIKQYPCRYCTPETGRKSGCHDYCEKYLATKTPSKTELYYKKMREFENSCGNYLGYIFYPDGRVKGKRIDFVSVSYRNGTPYIKLCDNGISKEYRLDKAVYRAYHPDYNIEHGANVLHRDLNQKNCAIKNLYIE